MKFAAFIILVIVILTILSSGCAGTSDKMASALNAYADAHELVQKAADNIQVICNSGRTMFSDKDDLAAFDSLCDDTWDLFWEYKRITDVFLKVKEE